MALADQYIIIILYRCFFNPIYAIEKARELRIHTRIEFIETELRQSYEYKQLLQNSIYFPNDPVFNLSKELKLLSIAGAVLSGDEFVELRKLAELMKNIFRRLSLSPCKIPFTILFCSA